MYYNPIIHQRRSIRLAGYDYTKEGLYFITLSCQDKVPFFGEIINGKMILNDAGRITQEEWEKTIQIRDNIDLHEFVVMPDHFHAIIEIKFSKKSAEQGSAKAEFKSPSQTIGAIIRGFKGASSNRIKKFYFSGSTGELQFAPTSPKLDKTLPKSASTLSKLDKKNDKTSHKMDELQFAPTTKIWQRNYFEHIIRDEQAYLNISNYIKNNPANWRKGSLKRDNI